MVLVEVAKHPNKAAQKPNTLKLSSVIEVRRIPPTMGTNEAQIRQSKYFLHTNHCNTTALTQKKRSEQSIKDLCVSCCASLLKKPVVAGVKDLIVCMKETGMYLRLMFPNTMLIQKTNDIGKILFHLSSGSTTINGLIFRTLITMYAPIDEHMKWTHETDNGNLKSSFCNVFKQNCFSKNPKLTLY